MTSKYLEAIDKLIGNSSDPDALDWPTMQAVIQTAVANKVRWETFQQGKDFGRRHRRIRTAYMLAQANYISSRATIGYNQLAMDAAIQYIFWSGFSFNTQAIQTAESHYMRLLAFGVPESEIKI